MDTIAIRIGGLCGFAAALVMIPAYVVGSPDAPKSASEAERYYESNSTFVTANGVFPILHLLFFVVFLGALISLLRRAENGRSGFAIAALAGGVIFVTLQSAGWAAEVAYPAALVRFEELPLGSGVSPVLLSLSAWLYHYCQVGAAVLIFATSAIIWRTEVLPRWVAGRRPRRSGGAVAHLDSADCRDLRAGVDRRHGIGVIARAAKNHRTR